MTQSWGASQYPRGQGCHPEWLRQAGRMGWQGSCETEQVLSPTPEMEKPLQQHRLGRMDLQKRSWGPLWAANLTGARCVPSQQRWPTARIAAWRSTASRWHGRGYYPLTEFITAHLEYCIQSWAPFSLPFTTIRGRVTRGNGHKLKQERCFPMKTVRHWSQLPREAVSSLSFDVFKTWVDKALSNLVWPHRRSCSAQAAGLAVPCTWITLCSYDDDTQ